MSFKLGVMMWHILRGLFEMYFIVVADFIFVFDISNRFEIVGNLLKTVCLSL